VCVSESVAEAERASGVPAERIAVIENGVRLDAAWSRERARAALGLDHHQSMTIGIVGQLRPEKAHEVLLEAVAASAQSGRDVRLCVVGDGARRTELQLLSAKLGIDSRVTWAGERRDAATLARAFDMSVICSHWEGLPLAALEAMAAGVPLIATRVGGLSSLLAGGAGELVDAGSVEQLSSAINTLVDDSALRAQLGASGAARVAEQYSFGSMVQRIQALYDDATRVAPPRSNEAPMHREQAA
jgi:glycosyltransferase involved in cell wall biosynthesis